jgi:hypothetical protein
MPRAQPDDERLPELLDPLPELPDMEPRDIEPEEEVRPAVSSISPLPEPMFCDHSLTWSLKRLIWSLIWLRRDHRKTPAPTAAAAAAAAAIGRSRAISITPPLLRLLLLLLPLRPDRLPWLFLAIFSLLLDCFALQPHSTIESARRFSRPWT